MANLGVIAITALIFAVMAAAVTQAEGNADEKVGISRFLAAQYKTVKCSHVNGICQKESSKSKSHVKLICCKQNCVNPLTDRYNCGACGKACSFGYACCKGKCLNTAYDRNNCGSCGVSCSKKNKCIYGMCSYA